MDCAIQCTYRLVISRYCWIGRGRERDFDWKCITMRGKEIPSKVLPVVLSVVLTPIPILPHFPSWKWVEIWRESWMTQGEGVQILLTLPLSCICCLLSSVPLRLLRRSPCRACCMWTTKVSCSNERESLCSWKEWKGRIDILTVSSSTSETARTKRRMGRDGDRIVIWDTKRERD